MSDNEEVYLDLLRDILSNGKRRDDRTGVGTIGVFGRQMRFDLTDGFPLLTTKQLPIKGIISELLWFLEGSGDERRLAEIRYGKPRAELEGKSTIWTENANSPYWKPKAQFEGDLGRPYGVMWRDWQSPVAGLPHATGWLGAAKSVDQVQILIDNLKKDPFSRRHILTAWNPGELDKMALPPCHMMSQFYVEGDELSCLMTQRSGDAGLGIPFNIASYALLTKMIAQVCGLKAREFIHSLGDAHIYIPHIPAIEEQLTRDVRHAPELTLNPDVKSIFDFKMSDFTLSDYDPHPPIHMQMAV